MSTITVRKALAMLALLLLTLPLACDDGGGGDDGDTDTEVPTFEGQLAEMNEGYEIAADGRYAYWSETGDAILKRVPVGSGDVEEIINGAINGAPGTLAVDEEHLYIATEFDPDQLLLRYDKETGDLETFEAGCEDLAASDSYVFCTSQSDALVRRVAKADMAVEPFDLSSFDASEALLAGSGAIFAAGDGQTVVVADEALSTPVTYDLSPRTLTALAVGGGSAWAGAVDFSSNEVSILRLSGGQISVERVLDTVTTQFVSSLAADGDIIYAAISSSFTSGDGTDYNYDGRVDGYPVGSGAGVTYADGIYPVEVAVDEGAVYWSQVVKLADPSEDTWTLHRALK